ncbi:hypothetical protein E2542_SST01360 [Spatholobus suberectus]|nr:hypothetical protein E2542_SST01360 [Spatholobus suberectus]
MATQNMELIIESAEDLKDVNLFTTMNVMAKVSLFGDPSKPQGATTNVHKKGGTNPVWNTLMRFPINEPLAKNKRLSLGIEIISDRIVAGETVIGTVDVPLKELLDNPGDGSSFRQVSYPVRRPSGKFKGSFNFSYKFGEHVAAPAEPEMAYLPPAQPGSVCPEPTARGAGLGAVVETLASDGEA